MRLVQRVLVEREDGDWADLRKAALDYGVICGGVLPRDQTHLRRWWLDFPKACLDGQRDQPLIDHIPRWNAVSFILGQAGGDLAFSVRRQFIVYANLSHHCSGGCTG